ncbi:pyrroline-5-carboxylate reductase [Bacillus sp. FSL W7-1360]
MSRILFIGAGRMAEAMFSRLLAQPKRLFKTIYISNNTNKTHLAHLAERYDVQPITNWTDVVDEVDAIILATPPSTQPEQLRTLSPLIRNQIIITIAAGIGPSILENHLPEGTATAWIMPNTAAEIGASMSLYTFGKHVNASQKTLTENILAAIGTYEELPEEAIHNLTAITGSAPAFVYEFVLQLENAATSYGISPTQARKLVVAMLHGSANLLEKTNDPVALRDAVTTPGGATAAGLQSLADHQFGDMLTKAVEAVNAHAKARKN